ncbi:hypothetical protein PIB30_060811 [Stylosanthes scabra]|uniref:Transposase (putative) gypsy type domain-containing protein n=1 Tax=Stylosanthes scabra TaxID=79078 RepID=A0ABU6ZJB3_9FABA|nr:hypothetical protein [Stylosanthes scabra]
MRCPRLCQCCEWIESDVLGARSVVDEDFVKSFCEHYDFCVSDVESKKYRLSAPGSEERVCYVDPEGDDCIFVYESIFTKAGVKIPFTEFEVEVLRECKITPSQIHPNSWGFLRAYQVECQELGIPISLCVFHHLFKLTKPFSKDKQQWLSFRANQGRKVFRMNEESVKDFKNLFFKVAPLPGTTPFWLDGEGKYRFPLTSNKEWVNPKVERKELSEFELLFVDALSECWGEKDHHLPTRSLLNKSSHYIQNEIFGALAKQVEEVDDDSPTELRPEGSASPHTSLPTSSPAPELSLGKDRSATPSPSQLVEQEVDNRDKGNPKLPPSRKRKAFELNCIKAVAIFQATQNKLRGSVVVPDGEVERLRTQLKAVEAEKYMIEGKKFELSSKITTLEARLALETQDLNAMRELLKKSEKERLEWEEKFKSLYVEFKLKIGNQRKLEEELQAAQEMCDRFSQDAMLVVEETVSNLKDQLRILLLEFNVDQIGPDNKVENGVIIRPIPSSEDQVPPEGVVVDEEQQVGTPEGGAGVQPMSSNPPPTPTF